MEWFWYDSINNILREVLLPQFHYCFSFYSYSIKSYNDFDVTIRKFVKQFLHLPHDVPNSFFYTSISDGSLGLFNARQRAPLLRYNKLKLFSKNLDAISNSLHQRISKEMENIYDLIRLDSDRYISSSSEINKFFRNSLYNYNDSRDLDIAGCVAGQNSWVFRPNSFLSGRDFINYVKLRINTPFQGQDYPLSPAKGRP